MKHNVLNRLMSLSEIFKASIVSFIAIIALGIYEFTLPIFTESQAESFAIVGLVFSLIYVASFLAEIPTGLAVDKYGRVKVLLFAMSAMACLGVVYFFTQNIFLLAILSLVFGAFAVGFWIPSAVLVRDYSPRNMLSQAEGIYLDIMQLGRILAPIIAGLVAVAFLAKFNFLLISMFMFMAVIFSLIVFRKHKHKQIKEKTKGHKHKAGVRLLPILFKEFISVHKHTAPLYALTFIVYIWMAVEWAFVPLAGITRYGFTDVGAGIILSAMMAIEGVLYYFSGYFMDKIGKKYIITGGFLLLFTSTYFMFLAINPLIFILAALFAAAAVAWIIPGTEALLTEVVPTNLYGEMSGVFDTSKDLGLIVGPLASGLIAAYLVNPLAPFLFVALAAGTAALISGWIFWPAKAKKNK